MKARTCTICDRPILGHPVDINTNLGHYIGHVTEIVDYRTVAVTNTHGAVLKLPVTMLLRGCRP